MPVLFEFMLINQITKEVWYNIMDKTNIFVICNLILVNVCSDNLPLM